MWPIELVDPNAARRLTRLRDFGAARATAHFFPVFLKEMHMTTLEVVNSATELKNIKALLDEALRSDGIQPNPDVIQDVMYNPDLYYKKQALLPLGREVGKPTPALDGRNAIPLAYELRGKLERHITLLTQSGVPRPRAVSLSAGVIGL